MLIKIKEDENNLNSENYFFNDFEIGNDGNNNGNNNGNDNNNNIFNEDYSSNNNSEIGSNGNYSDGETSSSSYSTISNSSNSNNSPQNNINNNYNHLNPFNNNNNYKNNNNHDNNTPQILTFPLQFWNEDNNLNNNTHNNNNNNNDLMLHKSTPLITQQSNKRVKRETGDDRLMKNREAANRSRIKRKNEKLEMEDTIAELKERVKTLELENTALLADNTSLHNQNLYLKSLLSNCEVTKKPMNHFNGAVSGVTVLCLVCMCTIFNDWLPPILSINSPTSSSSSSSASSSYRPSGRVLLSMHDIPSIHMPPSSAPYTHGIESSPQSYLKMGLLLLIVIAYFGYLKYVQKSQLQKNGWILP